jgi:O-antigen/teichoic acid export membrane protein
LPRGPEPPTKYAGVHVEHEEHLATVGLDTAVAASSGEHAGGDQAVARGGGNDGPSLALNSLARLTSDGATFILGVLAAIMTARWLGPADKGTLSTLTFIGALAMLASTLGLGDAAIVELNRRRAPLDRTLSATVAAVGALSIAGALALGAVVWLIFPEMWRHASAAVVATAASVPIAAFVTVLSQVLNASERITLTSGVALLSGFLSTAGLWLFIHVLGLSVLGGVVASGVGSAIGLAALVAALGPGRRALWPRWHGEYLKGAVRYGSVVLASYLLISLSGRADLLLVYGLSGQADAGQYSVALTISVLVAYASMAIVYAGFPRIASIGEDEAFELVGRIWRLGILSAVLVAALLAALIPVLIRALFGAQYTAATTPALLLLPGGILYSGQFILARASAAHGDARLLIRAFTASMVVMLALDAVLIPRAGITGAAVAGSIGPAAGLAVNLWHYRKNFSSVQEAMLFYLPRGDDARGLLASVAGVARRISGGRHTSS